MTGSARLAEAHDGITYVRDEISTWISDVSAHSPQGAHRSRLTILEQVLTITLNEVESAMSPPENVMSVAYRDAGRADKRSLFCRRLFRWYALRFDQRRDSGLSACLLGADEVVWSVWKRTFDGAGVSRPPPPLCFIDNDPVAWASFHHALPHDTQPPSMDPFFQDRIRALPIPVIGLPPLVAYRPWWIVVAIHEVGHHVQHALAAGLVGSVGAAVRAAATAAQASPAEAKQWSDWSGEMFADAFAAVFGGPASLWVIAELERAAPDLFIGRGTYPPAVVRLKLAESLVVASGYPKGDEVALTDSDIGLEVCSVGHLLDRLPAVRDALLDHPLGATTLRQLSERRSPDPDDVATRAELQARWAAALGAGTAQAVPTIEAAADCVSGAVLAWQAEREQDPKPLSQTLLKVLPKCAPAGTRAGESDSAHAAAQNLLTALLDDGAAI